MLKKDYKNNQYDKDALYDGEIITVNTADAFIAAFTNLEQDQIITLTGDIDMTGKLYINGVEQDAQDSGFNTVKTN